jgi:hypothetical protein
MELKEVFLLSIGVLGGGFASLVVGLVFYRAQQSTDFRAVAEKLGGLELCLNEFRNNHGSHQDRQTTNIDGIT